MSSSSRTKKRRPSRTHVKAPLPDSLTRARSASLTPLESIAERWKSLKASTRLNPHKSKKKVRWKGEAPDELTIDGVGTMNSDTLNRVCREMGLKTLGGKTILADRVRQAMVYVRGSYTRGITTQKELGELFKFTADQAEWVWKRTALMRIAMKEKEAIKATGREEKREEPEEEPMDEELRRILAESIMDCESPEVKEARSNLETAIKAQRSVDDGFIHKIVAADGSCLFGAVALMYEGVSVDQVRDLCGAWMAANADVLVDMGLGDARDVVQLLLEHRTAQGDEFDWMAVADMLCCEVSILRLPYGATVFNMPVVVARPPKEEPTWTIRVIHWCMSAKNSTWHYDLAPIAGVSPTSGFPRVRDSLAPVLAKLEGIWKGVESGEGACIEVPNAVLEKHADALVTFEYAAKKRGWEIEFGPADAVGEEERVEHKSDRDERRDSTRTAARLATGGITLWARVRPRVGIGKRTPCVEIENDVVSCGEKECKFTQAFDACTNAELIPRLVPALMEQLVKGTPVVLMAYGSSGSGKTHTLMGDAVRKDEGLVYGLLNAVFAEEATMEVSMRAEELYGTVRLERFALLPERERLRSDAGNKVVIADAEEGQKMVELARERTITCATGLNPQSSRGHTVCWFAVRQRTEDGERVVPLVICDLAGSEGATAFSEMRDAEMRKRVQKEAALIKQQLTQLSCALGDLKKGGTSVKGKGLVRVLYPVLRRSSAITLLATFHPSQTRARAAANTLRTISSLAAVELRPKATPVQKAKKKARTELEKKEPEKIQWTVCDGVTEHTVAQEERATQPADEERRALSEPDGQADAHLKSGEQKRGDEDDTDEDAEMDEEQKGDVNGAVGGLRPDAEAFEPLVPNEPVIESPPASLTFPESIKEMMAGSVPMIEQLPSAVSQEWAEALSRTLGAALRNSGDEEAWVRVGAFTRCVMWQKRGGRGTRHQRERVVRIRERLLRWTRGEYDSLWRAYAMEANRLAAKRRKRKEEGEVVVEAMNQRQSNRERCVELARENSYSKAVKALSSSGCLPVTADVFAALEERHPFEEEIRDEEEPPTGCYTAMVSVDEILDTLQKADRTSSGGVDLIRVGYLKDVAHLEDATGLFTSLATVATLILRNMVPVCARELLLSARLVPLRKKDDTPRPIAVGSILRRLAAGVLWKRAEEELVKACGRFQLGVGVSGGVELMVQRYGREAARAQRDGGRALLRIDFRNAFNCFSRHRLIAVVAERVPDALPYFKACYSRWTPLFLSNGLVVHSRTGVQQGDPLGPALFAIGLAALLKEVTRRCVENADTVLAYLDDAFIAGSLGAVEEFFVTLVAVSEEYGMTVRPDKCHWVSLAAMPASLADLDVLDDETPSCTEVLNVPIGERVNERMEGRVAEWMATCDEILELGDQHVAIVLFRACLGFGKFQYWNRLMASPSEDGWRRVVDTTTCNFFGRLAGSPMDRMAYRQMGLPSGKGGIGVRSLSHYASAATLASAMTVCSSLRRMSLVPDTSEQPLQEVYAEWISDGDLDTALRDYNTRANTTWEKSDIYYGRVVKPFVALDDQALAQLAHDLPEPRRRMLRELSRKGAAEWLRAWPSQSAGLAVSNETIRFALLMRLGMPMTDPFRRVQCAQLRCTEECDTGGLHALRCRFGRGWTNRHDKIGVVVLQLARAAGITDASIEHRDGLHRMARSADIYLPRGGYYADSAVSVDIGVTTRSLRQSDEEQRKNDGIKAYWCDKFQQQRVERCAANGETYMPAIISITGTFEDHFSEFVNTLADMAASRSGRKADPVRRYWRLRIHMALLRGNAQMLAAHIPMTGRYALP